MSENSIVRRSALQNEGKGVIFFKRGTMREKHFKKGEKRIKSWPINIHLAGTITPKKRFRISPVLHWIEKRNTF